MPGAKLRCMKDCLGCDKEVVKIDTRHAHMIQLVVNGKQKTRFLCDKCKNQQNENIHD